MKTSTELGIRFYWFSGSKPFNPTTLNPKPHPVDPRAPMKTYTELRIEMDDVAGCGGVGLEPALAQVWVLGRPGVRV